MKIVEAEKLKVNTYAEQLRQQREKEEIPYNYDQDFRVWIHLKNIYIF